MLNKLEESRRSRNEKDRNIKYETNSSNEKLMTSHDIQAIQERTIVENRKEDFVYH